MRHILIVEDHPPDVFLFREAIRQGELPADVEIAQTVERAEAALGSRVFDLVILDLNLPQTDGFTLLRKQMGTGGPPIVVFTSSDRPADRLEALALGARDYIVKPAGFFPMIEAAQSILKRWLPEAEQTSGGAAFLSLRLCF